VTHPIPTPFHSHTRIESQESKEPQEQPRVDFKTYIAAVSEEEEDESKGEDLLPSPFVPAQPQVALTRTAPPVQIAVVASDQVAHFFEQMVNQLSHVKTPLVQQTTITLTSPKLQASSLNNTLIVISEYSTAPRAFNVECLTTPQGAALMAVHLPALLEGFNEKRESFKIHRFDISLKEKEKKARTIFQQPITKP
jgi:hypothetical protein